MDIDLGDEIDLEDDENFNDGGAEIGGGVDDGMNEENFDEAINQEHVWIVITKFFDERGLVKQQIDSFDEFINTTLQTAVNEKDTQQIYPQKQYMPGADDDLTDEADTYYEVKFDQVFLAGPTITEQDGVSRAFDPREARLRSLTYAAPLYVDVTGTWYKVETDISVRRERKLNGMKNLDNQLGNQKSYLNNI